MPIRVEDLPTLHDPPALTAAQMAEIDRVAIEEFGIGLEMLMENASRQIAHAARACLGGNVTGKRIVALAGHGSNGGDALGAARHLLNWGGLVTAVVAGSPERLRPVPRRQFDILTRWGGASRAGAPAPGEGLRPAAPNLLTRWGAGEGLRPAAPNLLAAMASSPQPTRLAQGEELLNSDALEAELSRAALVVDGLLGYSATGPPRGEVVALIRLANRSRAPILAIDLPSGMHPDSGQPLGVAVRAAFTVTLALPKLGLLATPSRNLVGELLLADIAIPPLAYARFGIDASQVFAEGDLVRVAR